jgi:NADPH:quinone reductase-like Zn-dependent oxidoreductase
VNYKTQDFAKKFERATGGHGADVVIDVVGASHWDKNIAALAHDGRTVMLRFLSGRELQKVDLCPLLLKRLRIQGTTLRARSVPYQADLVERFTRDVVGKLTGAEGHGELETYVHKVLPWTEIRAAHEEMEGNKNSGKIIVEVQ